MNILTLREIVLFYRSFYNRATLFSKPNGVIQLLVTKKSFCKISLHDPQILPVIEAYEIITLGRLREITVNNFLI